ncbi:hypothetical protein PAT3040_01923 [Paenibacillus agaridevorans]|uniref:Uncharacterized protein n=1 Tax=Paenibacillus agaridevorans TaxID=171404 RepID=A0A2R5EMN3_9BACL|nr:hypothetical protein [Paenibacillus agaridevorans]GBG07375.1 hypothetical protein PAT3040_01923 [Paenibacillus agaridevorans]
MNRLKVILSFILIFTLGSTLAHAEENVLSEEQYEQILIDAGMPQALIDNMDFYDKQFIVENSSGSDLQFDGYSESAYAYNTFGELAPVVTPPPGVVTPFANIPSTDLVLTMFHFVTTYNGVQLHDIYGTFEWLANPHQSTSISYYGIQNDHIGMAVPADWEIQDDKYACATQYKNIGNGNVWSAPSSAGCNDDDGSPVEDELYGSAWEFGGNLTDMPATKYKGTVKFALEKKVSTATERAVIKYSQSKPLGGVFSTSISFGPATVNFNPSIGTNDTASADISW